MPITIEINGVEQVIADLEGIKARARDLRPALKACKLIVLESVQRNFLAGGRPKWRELAPSTIERRMRKSTGYRTYRSGKNKGRIITATAQNIGAAGFQVLRDTGMLMTSLDLDRKENPTINELTNTTLRVGTNLPYAGVHQYGSKKVPARPFMLLQPADEERIVAIMRDHVLGERA